MSDIDPKRCIKSVYSRAMNFPRGKQCQRARTHGEYCAQHAPENVAKRYEKAREDWRAENARIRRSQEIKAAASAIVDAADKWQRTRDDLGAEFEGDSELAAAVDAWRKLKGM